MLPIPASVTIQEVADLAQVSSKTVSRVINNEPLVRDDDRHIRQRAHRHYEYVTSNINNPSRRRPRVFCDVVTPQEPGFRLRFGLD